MAGRAGTEDRAIAPGGAGNGGQPEGDKKRPHVGRFFFAAGGRAGDPPALKKFTPR